ncbi:DUF3231 family protein [Heyndrickxia camelliae]|uniref:DUF3231 family protein n=1 Tax=Heyndrickxia camelliae TaxID=1707093 RepID=A0A2N3LK51_9BACI|nr:DUF3231 family protein [Heyndrickxia camelliae]PKR84986.1 hypothetical protein CWO92_11535 [Heyndrickxia camelliae]
MPKEHIPLTSSEIASLWTSFMNFSMSKCMLAHMKRHIQDTEIKPIIEMAESISSDNIKWLTTIFETEKFALPVGFSKEDVNLNAAPLFTDTFCLTYVHHMSRTGMIASSGFIAMCAREDIRMHFSHELLRIVDLYNKSSDTMLNKGLFVKAPCIMVPAEVDFIDSSSYLSGFNLFSKKRPLNAVEICHLYMNTQTNMIGVKLCLAFAQNSPTKEVQKYMMNGKEISEKHIKIFSSILLDDHIQVPMGSDIAITNSTEQVFSDKLVMFHMGFLSAAGTGNYATAAAASQRTDLVTNYERLSIEIAQFAKNGADIMIKHQWLEQPPGTVDKDKLAKKKND